MQKYSNLPPETVTYLELNDRRDFRASRKFDGNVDITLQQPPDPQLNRHLYNTVGGDWLWIDRLPWTDDEWHGYANQPNLETWIARVQGEFAGYFELLAGSDSSVEIVQFGVVPGFIGRGLGGHLLTAAVERGWETGASRVWLHTSSRDHPNAQANYQARGFLVFKREGP